MKVLCVFALVWELCVLDLVHVGYSQIALCCLGSALAQAVIVSRWFYEESVYITRGIVNQVALDTSMVCRCPRVELKTLPKKSVSWMIDVLLLTPGSDGIQHRVKRKMMSVSY